MLTSYTSMLDEKLLEYVFIFLCLIFKLFMSKIAFAVPRAVEELSSCGHYILLDKANRGLVLIIIDTLKTLALFNFLYLRDC